MIVYCGSVLPIFKGEIALAKISTCTIIQWVFFSVLRDWGLGPSELGISATIKAKLGISQKTQSLKKHCDSQKALFFTLYYFNNIFYNKN